MRTALRTYHPVPSLQKVDANLQDAPRIKNILKACSLKDEAATNMPVTPAELRARAVSTRSTHLTLFVLFRRPTPGNWHCPIHKYRQSSLRPLQSLHRSFSASLYVHLLTWLSQSVAHDHFECQDVDFLDLFLPIKISSPSRARAFLWLAFHYHEKPSVNPFDDQRARKHLGLIPELVPLSAEEFEKENVDPEDERNYAAKMTKLRIDFLAKNAQQGGENNNTGNPKDRKAVAKSVPTKRERSDPDSAVGDDSDHLGLFLFHSWFTLVLLTVSPLRPSFTQKTTESSKGKGTSRAFRVVDISHVQSTLEWSPPLHSPAYGRLLTTFRAFTYLIVIIRGMACRHHRRCLSRFRRGGCRRACPAGLRYVITPSPFSCPRTH